jgi:hypothetical protein
MTAVYNIHIIFTMRICHNTRGLTNLITLHTFIFVGAIDQQRLLDLIQYLFT